MVQAANNSEMWHQHIGRYPVADLMIWRPAKLGTSESSEGNEATELEFK